jgi:oligopeptide transport system substrate-binding protein
MIRWIATALLAVCAAVVPAAQGATLHRGLGPAPDTLDIHRAQGLSAFNLLRDLHEGLLTRDARGRPVPAIAEDWEATDDGRVWRFRLDPDAHWSDGSPITARDFVRGFERARRPETASPTAAWLDAVDAIRADGPHRLRIRLTRPVPWFEELLTLPVAFPWRGGERTLYSGPFRLVQRVPGARFDLVRNEHYREVDAVELAGVVWHVTQDPSAELSRFRAGELHITETVPPGRYEWLARELGDALRVAPYYGSFYLGFNLSRPPFADRPDLRAALSLAIDRDLLAERVLGAGERPAWRLVPPDLEEWPAERPEAARLPAAERLRRARMLLERSGYDRARPIELRFNSSLSHRRLAAAVAAMWKQHLGLSTRMVHEEWKVFVTNRRQGRITEIVRGGWIADWADPVNFLGNFRSGSPLNYVFFEDREFDRLLARAERLSGRKRMDMLRLAETRLLRQHAVIPLYYYVSRHLVHPDVRGWRDNPMDIHLSRWMALEAAGRHE